MPSFVHRVLGVHRNVVLAAGLGARLPGRRGRRLGALRDKVDATGGLDRLSGERDGTATEAGVVLDDLEQVAWIDGFGGGPPGTEQRLDQRLDGKLIPDDSATPALATGDLGDLLGAGVGDL